MTADADIHLLHYASLQRIRREVAEILTGYGKGWARFQSGPRHPPVCWVPERAGVFVAAVHEMSGAYHR